jgi:hypothetical protein
MRSRIRSRAVATAIVSAGEMGGSEPLAIAV